jgi:F-type H+-transporting ATPase subunit b
VSPALANLLFEAANFLLLAGALGWLLFKPVRRVLDRDLEQRAKQDAEVKQMQAEAKALLAKARAAEDDADRETAKRREEILAAARSEAERILAEARQSEVSERRAFASELEARRAGEARALADTVGEIAGDAIRRLLETLEGPELDAALTRAACDELAALPAGGRAPALVESAHQLDATLRQQLEAAIGGEFEARVIGELGAGVRVTTPAGQIDATTRSIARQAAREVTRSRISGRTPAPEPADD